MNKIISFNFNDRETYQEFTQAIKAQNIALIEQLRAEKNDIKEQQRQNAAFNVSYVKMWDLRAEFQASQELREKAKREANRQYEKQRQAIN